MSGAMGSHQSTRAMSTTWLTPLEIITDLGPFDLDPCGFTGWPTAERLIVLPHDGLTADGGASLVESPVWARDLGVGIKTSGTWSWDGAHVR